MRISDWSSDVCFSDLPGKVVRDAKSFGAGRDLIGDGAKLHGREADHGLARGGERERNVEMLHIDALIRETFERHAVGAPRTRRGEIGERHAGARSEERRVGKACVRRGRTRWWPY